MKRILVAAFLALYALPAVAQQQIYRPITSYRTSISSTEVTGPKAFGTNVARVLCTVTCHVAMAVSPVVVSLTVPVTLNPNQREYFRVSVGGAIYIKADAAGVVYVTELE